MVLPVISSIYTVGLDNNPSVLHLISRLLRHHLSITALLTAIPPAQLPDLEQWRTVVRPALSHLTPPACANLGPVNQARSMRVAEIINDYRNIQNYIASIRANPSAEEYEEDGYVLLRRSVAQAQTLLVQPFNAQHATKGDDEQIKSQLRR